MRQKSVFLVLLLAFVLTACSEPTSPAQVPATSTPKPATETKAPTPKNDMKEHKAAVQAYYDEEMRIFKISDEANASIQEIGKAPDTEVYSLYAKVKESVDAHAEAFSEMSKLDPPENLQEAHDALLNCLLLRKEAAEHFANYIDNSQGPGAMEERRQFEANAADAQTAMMGGLALLIQEMRKVGVEVK